MAMFDALLAVDPNSLQSAAGLAGKVYLATDTARTSPLEVTDLNGIPYANQQIVAGPNGFVPAFLTPGDEVAVVWVSGPWVFPLKSIEGVDAKATTAQMTASEALSRADAALAGGGTGGGNVTVDTLSGATAIGKAVVKATTPDAARGAIGAGTSNVTVGTGAGQAQPAANAVRTDGNQTITGVKTFSTAPVVPANSFQQDRVVGLVQALADLANGGGEPVVETPTAAFTHTTSGLTVSFDGSTSTAPAGRTVAEYWWNFGNGPVRSTTPQTSHTFTAAGTASVTLFVIDSTGAQSPTVSRPVTTVAPANVGPNAAFTTTVTNLTVAVNAGASSDPDGVIVSYSTTYEAGVTKAGLNTSHTYAAAGTYTIGLTVTDDKGATHSATQAVTVAAAPAPAPVYVFVRSPTENTQQVALRGVIEAFIGRAVDENVPDSTADLGARLAAPNVIGIITDGSSTTTLASTAPNLLTNPNPLLVFEPVLAASLNMGTRNDLASGDAWTTAYLPAAAVGKPYAAGKTAGAYPYLNSAQATRAWTGLGAGAEVVLQHVADPVAPATTPVPRAISMVYEKGAALATGTAAGRRAFGQWRSANPAGVFTQHAKDFVGGLIAWARSVAAAPTGTPAPTLDTIALFDTTATGSKVRKTYTTLANADLQLFEVSSYSTNGGLPYATILATDETKWIGGDATRRFRESGELAAGRTPEFWAKAVVNGVVSTESNHRQITITSTGSGGGGGGTPQVDVTLKPFMNQAGIRFEMQGTANSTTSVTQGEIVPPVWYLGQPTTGVVYEAADSPATLDIRRTDTPLKMNQGTYGHGIRYATVNDPLTEVQDTKDPGRSLLNNTAAGGADMRVHIPSDQTAAIGDDGHSHVVQPPDENGVRWIVEMIGFARIDATTVRATRVHKIRMDGHGLGPTSGVRAYGGAATAGLIRSWEIDPAHPNYTGRIDHVLALALAWRQLKSMWIQDTAVLSSIQRWDYWTTPGTGTNQTHQPGWPSGMRRIGPSNQPNVEGFIKREMPFPVTEEDHSGPSDYFGNVIYGTLVVIPPTVTASSLGITKPESLMVFNALRDYGAMVVDCVGADMSMPLYIEHNGPSAWRQAISGTDFAYSDLQKMKAQLRIVSGARNWQTPNGGPLGVARRGVAVPGFP